jgi:hypothetical protein
MVSCHGGNGQPPRTSRWRQLWQRLLGWPVSESGRLRRGNEPTGGAIAAGRVLELATLRFRHLIACGLIGEPVPPVMTSGGAQ